jgi:hypothetical protein
MLHTIGFENDIFCARLPYKASLIFFARTGAGCNHANCPHQAQSSCNGALQDRRKMGRFFKNQQKNHANNFFSKNEDKLCYIVTMVLPLARADIMWKYAFSLSEYLLPSRTGDDKVSKWVLSDI